MEFKLKEEFSKEFTNYNDKDNKFRDGNSILYRMVYNHPSNKKDDWIVAKFWLIGRSYAAAIERRTKKAVEETKGEFYYNYVVPTIKELKLDARIKNIKKNFSEINENTIKEVIKLHKDLEDAIYKITYIHKKSLVSKYLFTAEKTKSPNVAKGGISADNKTMLYQWFKSKMEKPFWVGRIGSPTAAIIKAKDADKTVEMISPPKKPAQVFFGEMRGLIFFLPNNIPVK